MTKPGESRSCIRFRIGDIPCLTLSSSVDAIVELPRQLVTIPGTKPLLFGAGSFGRSLLPYIHLAGLLNIGTDDQKIGAVMVVRTPDGLDMCGVCVEEILGFSPANVYTDVESPALRIPAALGSALCRILTDGSNEWALIDLHALITDQHLQNIELN